MFRTAKKRSTATLRARSREEEEEEKEKEGHMKLDGEELDPVINATTSNDIDTSAALPHLFASKKKKAKSSLSSLRSRGSKKQKADHHLGQDRRSRLGRTTVGEGCDSSSYGMGFGGSHGAANKDNKDVDIDDNNDDDGLRALYDPEALSRLVAEQRNYGISPPLQHESGAEMADPHKSALGSGLLPWEERPFLPADALLVANATSITEGGGDNEAMTAEPDYLALDDDDIGAQKENLQQQNLQQTVLYSEPETILTGDDALACMMQNTDMATPCLSFNGFGVDNVDNCDVDDEVMNDEFECEVLRRAGVTVGPTKRGGIVNNVGMAAAAVENPPPQYTTTNNNNIDDGGNINCNDMPLALMGQLRSQIRDTMGQLHDQTKDMERRLERRTEEIATNQATIERYESELHVSDGALEFYNTWRKKLGLWIGAVRDLKLKVEPILQALHELEGERSAVDRWHEWENDVVSILQEHGVLEQVIGRQPPIPTPATKLETHTDEFGRDVTSQHVLHREKRRMHRQRVRNQRRSRIDRTGSSVDDGTTNPHFVRGDESDAFVSDGEVETLRERHDTLRQALTVALEGLDEEFTVLHHLVTFFDEWRSAFPEEYKQCFASLSLADIAGILVETELCSLNDHWNESDGYNEAKWTAVVHSAVESGSMDPVAVVRLIDKWVKPTITDLLDFDGINVTSTRQTQALGRFMCHLRKLLPPNSPELISLRSVLTSFATRQLQSIALPIVSKAGLEAMNANDDTDLQEALHAASWEQMHRMKKILLNLLKNWGSFMENDAGFVGMVLDFISSRFLCLLSSLNGVALGGFAESPADAFKAVYGSLVQTGWLDSPEFTLLALPIRAAANVYQVTA